MLRRLLPLTLLAPLMFAPAQAQEEPARSVELRVVALCRGYMRPMSATARRIADVDGVETCEMLGFGGDTARYRVTTKLNNEALAKTLQLNVLGSGEGFLTLSNADNSRAKRAEARGVVTQIALAISRQPKPSWNDEGEPLFDPAHSVRERMERLDLNPDLLNGTFYKPNDYHIEETWEYSEGTYRVWAGDRDESVNVPSENWWNEEPEPDRPPAGADSRFVGIRVYRSAWSNSMNWIDSEGLILDGDQGRRSETDDEGELYVKRGAEWMTQVMSASVAFLVRDPKLSIDGLPAGRGWNIFNKLEREGFNANYIRHYDSSVLTLRWREEGEAKFANLRAHHPRHPFYLELDVDASAVVENYRQRVLDENLDLSQVREADLGNAATWICGAEESVEVFRAREHEAEVNFTLLREALRKSVGTHALSDLCGNLDDEGLLQRLGAELKFEQFKPGDYVIAAQMLGDVEIAVGGVRTGGKIWMLANAASGNMVRRN